MLGLAIRPTRRPGGARPPVAGRLALAACSLVLLGGPPAAAATLTTSARVTIVPPATADLVGLDREGRPLWTVGGQADEPVAISLEWRTSDGAVLERLAGAVLLLDGAGRLDASDELAPLAPLAPPPPDAGPVLTLVICRE